MNITSSTSSNLSITSSTLGFNGGNHTHNAILNTPYTTSGSTWTLPTTPKLKKCRSCFHSHLAGQKVCISSDYGIGYMGVTLCNCEEYQPEDNLEYLEWKHKKGDSL